MQAETVRDSLLRVAGDLDTQLGGHEVDPSQGLTSRRRSLYFAHHGEDKMEFLELFDAPNPCDCYQRTVSIQPQQALAPTVAPVDLGIIAYQGFYLSQPQIDATMPLVRLWKPRALVVNHHDETGGRFLDMATEPFFMAVRDEMPQTRGYGLLYRSPMCINTATRQIVVGP